MDQNFNNQPNDYQNQYNQPQQNDYQNQYNQSQQNGYQNQYAQPQQNNYQNQYAQPQQNNYQNQYTQPQQYNQPYYNQQYPQYTETPDKSGKNFGIASLVLGILSVTCCCGGWIPCILGIIFGVLSRKRQPENNAMATVGLVLSIIGTVLAVISWIYLIATGFDTSSFYY